jgi:putative effector of murein hydrolase
MIVDASFLRCKNIDITWRLSEKALNDLNLKSMSVTASMNNIFVIASNKFNGMDPELKNSVMPKTFTLGLAIGL